MPSNRASGAARQAGELVPVPGAQTANVHPSAGGLSGDVTSQVTFAVSPGRGDARSGAPSTSIRAPMTRVFVMRDAGSNVGLHPAMKRKPQNPSRRVFLIGLVMIVLVIWGVIVVAFQSSPRTPRLGMSGRPETTPTWL